MTPDEARALLAAADQAIRDARAEGARLLLAAGDQRALALAEIAARLSVEQAAEINGSGAKAIEKAITRANKVQRTT